MNYAAPLKDMGFLLREISGLEEIARLPGYEEATAELSDVILEEAGVHDILCKSLGSANHINVARATIQGLKSLQRPDEVAARRGLNAEEFVPKGLLNAYNERQRGKAAEGASTDGTAQPATSGRS